MLRMAQIDYIKDLYENEDLSLREISRRRGHSFQTVQKYAYQENWSAEQLPNLEAENYPNLEQYIPSIDEWMEADRKLPRKQRHTAMRIYHRLVDEQGYQGSYSSVKRYVRKKKFVLKLAAEDTCRWRSPVDTDRWTSERACIMTHRERSARAMR